MFLNKHSFPTFYGEFVVFVLALHLSPVTKLPTSRFTIALGMEYIRLPSFYPSLHNTVTKHKQYALIINRYLSSLLVITKQRTHFSHEINRVCKWSVCGGWGGVSWSLGCVRWNFGFYILRRKVTENKPCPYHPLPPAQQQSKTSLGVTLTLPVPGDIF